MNKHTYLIVLLIAVLCWSCEQTGFSPATSQPKKLSELQGFTLTEVPGTDYQKAIRTSSDGVQLLEEGYLYNGLRQGPWVIYHADAQPRSKERRIQSITHYIQGQKHGIHIECNQNQRIELQESYTQDVLDGLSLKYNRSTLKERIPYVAGQLDGKYEQYNDNKKTIKQAFYQNGQLHGKWRTFNDEGKVVLEYEYSNGQKVSGGIVERGSQ